MSHLTYVFAFGCVLISSQQPCTRCLADEGDTINLDVHLSDSEENMLAELEALIAHPKAGLVHTLTISHTGVSERLTSQLRRLPGLRTLTIGNEAEALETVVEKDAYRHLAELTELQYLHLIDTSDEPYTASEFTSISFLSKLTKLQHLSLRANITPDDMNILLRLPLLESFSYSGMAEGISNQLWNRLVHKSSLRSLYLDRVGLNFSIRDVFKEPSKVMLTRLWLPTCGGRVWTGAEIKRLAELQRLTSLKIGRINASDTKLLEPLVNLEDLHLETKGALNDLSVVQSSLKMKRIRVYSTSFDAFRDLASHPRLSEVSIYAGHYDDSILRLATIPNLRILRLRGEHEQYATLKSALKDVELIVRK